MSDITQIAVAGILVVVAFVIALAIYPTLADSVAAAQASTNVTGVQDTLLGLIPLGVCAGLVISAVIYLVVQAKRLGASD